MPSAPAFVFKTREELEKEGVKVEDLEEANKTKKVEKKAKSGCC